jgi:hypothetical protein
MSNFLAIATATATLAELVTAAAKAAVSGATVSTKRPDSPAGDGTDPRVNIFLYQVIPNAAYRNADLPTRRPDGTLVDRPQAALDLHYLITFYGNEGELVPQRLLGSTVGALHAQPVLSRDSIRDLITNARYPHTTGEYLKTSDLADSVELVKFSPLMMNLEELSKLWSVFLQTSYVLSVAYQASVVLIQEGGPPQTALPVRSQGAVSAQAAGMPMISGVDPQILEYSLGAQLTVTGRGLGAEVIVTIGGADAPPPQVISDQKLVTQLPAAVMAGVQTVQAVQTINLGTSVEPHRGAPSNVVAFILVPHIDTITFTKPLDPITNQPVPTVTVTLEPQIGARQRVTLVLNTLPGAAPQAFTFTSTGRAASTASIAFAVTGVPVGSYLVRVSVDDAASVLTVDNATGLFNGPTVTITP